MNEATKQEMNEAEAEFAHFLEDKEEEGDKAETPLKSNEEEGEKLSLFSFCA